jgi:hypothetical protein
MLRFCRLACSLGNSNSLVAKLPFPRDRTGTPSSVHVLRQLLSRPSHPQGARASFSFATQLGHVRSRHPSYALTATTSSSHAAAVRNRSEARGIVAWFRVDSQLVKVDVRESLSRRMLHTQGAALQVRSYIFIAKYVFIAYLWSHIPMKWIG